ncbi:hypothetical protein R2F25_38235 [Streptomyces sp. UP1A-1]|nr:hypothetical protein [Streptomyces sp. UP1A-1]
MSSTYRTPIMVGVPNRSTVCPLGPPEQRKVTRSRCSPTPRPRPLPTHSSRTRWLVAKGIGCTAAWSCGELMVGLAAFPSRRRS